MAEKMSACVSHMNSKEKQAHIDNIQGILQSNKKQWDEAYPVRCLNVLREFRNNPVTAKELFLCSREIETELEHDKIRDEIMLDVPEPFLKGIGSVPYPEDKYKIDIVKTRDTYVASYFEQNIAKTVYISYKEGAVFLKDMPNPKSLDSPHSEEKMQGVLDELITKYRETGVPVDGLPGEVFLDIMDEFTLVRDVILCKMADGNLLYFNPDGSLNKEDTRYTKGGRNQKAIDREKNSEISKEIIKKLMKKYPKNTIFGYDWQSKFPVVLVLNSNQEPFTSYDLQGNEIALPKCEPVVFPKSEKIDHSEDLEPTLDLASDKILNPTDASLDDFLSEHPHAKDLSKMSPDDIDYEALEAMMEKALDLILFGEWVEFSKIFRVAGTLSSCKLDNEKGYLILETRTNSKQFLIGIESFDFHKMAKALKGNFPERVPTP